MPIISTIPDLLSSSSVLRTAYDNDKSIASHVRFDTKFGQVMIPQEVGPAVLSANLYAMGTGRQTKDYVSDLIAKQEVGSVSGRMTRSVLSTLFGLGGSSNRITPFMGEPKDAQNTYIGNVYNLSVMANSSDDVKTRLTRREAIQFNYRLAQANATIANDNQRMSPVLTTFLSVLNDEVTKPVTAQMVSDHLAKYSYTIPERWEGNRRVPARVFDFTLNTTQKANLQSLLDRKNSNLSLADIAEYARLNGITDPIALMQLDSILYGTRTSMTAEHSVIYRAINNQLQTWTSPKKYDNSGTLYASDQAFINARADVKALIDAFRNLSTS